MKVLTNRQIKGKTRCITLSDDAFNWVQQYAKLNGKSISLMIEMLIRSIALGKKHNKLIDYDLIRSLTESDSDNISR